MGQSRGGRVVKAVVMLIAGGALIGLVCLMIQYAVHIVAKLVWV